MGAQNAFNPELKNAIPGIRIKEVTTQEGGTTVIFDYPTRMSKLKTYQLVATAGGLRLELISSRCIRQ